MASDTKITTCSSGSATITAALAIAGQAIVRAQATYRQIGPVRGFGLARGTVPAQGIGLQTNLAQGTDLQIGPARGIDLQIAPAQGTDLPIGPRAGLPAARGRVLAEEDAEVEELVWAEAAEPVWAEAAELVGEVVEAEAAVAEVPFIQAAAC